MVRTETVVVHDRMRAGTPTAMVIVGDQPFTPLLDFFRERGLSLSAERAYAQTLARFIEWLSVRAEEFWPQDSRGLIYTAFAHDLLFGTYRDGEDALGLNWAATSQKNVARLTRCLVEFSDWLTDRHGIPSLNPMQPGASFSDQLLFWRRWNKWKAGSLLSHIKSRNRAVPKAEVARRIATPGRRNTVLQETKAFPAEHVDALLWRGFINPGKQDAAEPWAKFNLRDILITLLCLYGGCRESEPMHLWVDDVFVDPGDPDLALVLIHEPHDGLIDYLDPMTGAKRKTNRADYLQRFCGGKKPLTMENGRRHAGWKGNLLTHLDRNAFQVFWVDRNAGRVFLTLWRLYIEHVRPLALQTPWAFLTKDAKPLGAEAYSDSFIAAVCRIGLTSSKWGGTSTQALRHRYGQWLNELGIGEKEGQVAMHHRNVKSQQVYRQLGVAKVAAAMGDGQVLEFPNFESKP